MQFLLNCRNSMASGNHTWQPYANSLIIDHWTLTCPIIASTLVIWQIMYVCLTDWICSYSILKYSVKLLCIHINVDFNFLLNVKFKKSKTKHGPTNCIYTTQWFWFSEPTVSQILQRKNLCVVDNTICFKRAFTRVIISHTLFQLAIDEKWHHG